MTALSIHLRPKPYPYGLLALRLLGKLGGKNRRFLRNDITLRSTCNQTALADLSMEFQWSETESVVLKEFLSSEGRKESEDSQSPGILPIVLPLNSAVNLLNTVAQIDFDSVRSEVKQKRDDDAEFRVVLKRLSRKNLTKLWTEPADVIDFQAYSYDVVDDTVGDQAASALCVICTSLAALLDLDERPPDLATIGSSNTTIDPPMQQPRDCSANSAVASSQRSECLKAIVKGLLYGLSVSCVKLDSRICAKGVFHYVLGVLKSFQEHVVKIDANGSRLPDGGATNDYPPTPRQVDSNDVDVAASKRETAKLASHPEELGSLRPFGYFEVTAPLDLLNPFGVCEVIAEMMSQPTTRIQSNVVEFFEEVLRESIDSPTSNSSEVDLSEISAAQSAFYETLLEALCRFAETKPWNLVSGLRSAILMMTEVLGSRWAMQYEVELVHTAILSLKRSGKETPFAGVRAFQFFVSIFVSLYGHPVKWDSITCVPDVLAIDKDYESTVRGTSGGCTTPSDAVLNILIIELASTKQLVR